MSVLLVNLFHQFQEGCFSFLWLVFRIHFSYQFQYKYSSLHLSKKSTNKQTQQQFQMQNQRKRCHGSVYGTGKEKAISGPAAIAKYMSGNGIQYQPNGLLTYGAISPHLLEKIQNMHLRSLLSSLLKRCSPPQRQFPFKEGVAPPWWPTGEEEWWAQLGFPEDQMPPPYKTPHDLSKAWKVVVLTAVIKHLAPNKGKRHFLLYDCWQDKLTDEEKAIWLAVVKQELHPDAGPASSMVPAIGTSVLSSSRSSEYDVEGVDDGEWEDNVIEAEQQFRLKEKEDVEFVMPTLNCTNAFPGLASYFDMPDDDDDIGGSNQLWKF